MAHFYISIHICKLRICSTFFLRSTEKSKFWNVFGFFRDNRLKRSNAIIVFATFFCRICSKINATALAASSDISLSSASSANSREENGSCNTLQLSSIANSARKAWPFQRNGTPVRFKRHKPSLVPITSNSYLHLQLICKMKRKNVCNRKYHDIIYLIARYLFPYKKK